MSKILSFIVIIAMISTGVFVLFGEVLTEPFTRDAADIINYSFHVGRRGNIFFVRRDNQGQSLIALDSSGEEWLRVDILPYFGQDFFIDSIFYTETNELWLTGYDYDPETFVLKNVKIAAFGAESSSYIGEIYSKELDVFKDSRYRAVSSMDEDSGYIYFASLSGSLIEVYACAKDGSEPLRKINEFSAAQGEGILAYRAIAGGGVVAAEDDGSIVLYYAQGTADRITPQDIGLGAASFDSIWGGTDAFFIRDSVSGNVYSSPQRRLELTPVIEGAFGISSDTRGLITFADLHEVSLSGAGNVLGVLRTQAGKELFLGGYTFLPAIATLDRAQQAEITDWLILMAVIAAVVIVSVLVWEFFVHFMRMRMPLVMKQLLLSVLIVFAAFFALTRYALIPEVRDVLVMSYWEDLKSNAEVLLGAMEAGLPGDATKEDYRTYIENFGDYSIDRYEGPLMVYLITDEGGLRVAASSGKDVPGKMLNLALPYVNIENALKSGIPGEGQPIEIMTELGRRIAFIKPAGIDVLGDTSYICVLENTSNLDLMLDGFSDAAAEFLLITGAALIFLLTATFALSIANLRRVNRALQKIELGRFGTKVDIRSGDETYDLGNHVNNLSAALLDKDRSLKTLSTSYHRFIPESFLKLLGETRVENVRKDLYAKIKDASVLFVRFATEGEEGHGIFEKANLVLESIVPVVAQHGGTVYNFLHNGFEGVFESSAKDALEAALSIRDVCRTLAKQAGEQAGIYVDLRIVLTRGSLTLGFIGNQSRMEPIALSDVYSRAERLMSICFDGDVYISATGKFFDAIKGDSGDYMIRRVGKTIAGKGVVEMFDIYDSDPPALREFKRSYADAFEVGVNMFEKGDYKNASKMFMDIIKFSTADGISRNYLYLSENNMRNPGKQNYYTPYDDKGNALSE